MIEKLDKHLAHNINSCNMSQNIMVAHKAIEKINEIIDAVNQMQAQVAILEEHAHPTAKTPVDPYAEQRKWVGKLCRFWDDDDKYCVFGILDDIDDNSQISGSRAIYFDSESAGWWEHCEPVKPDDDIIYKGE